MISYSKQLDAQLSEEESLLFRRRMQRQTYWSQETTSIYPSSGESETASTHSRSQIAKHNATNLFLEPRKAFIYWTLVTKETAMTFSQLESWERRADFQSFKGSDRIHRLTREGFSRLLRNTAYICFACLWEKTKQHPFTSFAGREGRREIHFCDGRVHICWLVQWKG